MATLRFSDTFAALTGKPPFPWQQALYNRFSSGEIPPTCILPTGLGKTSVIAVWLIALANHPDKMPRRLVYVVNRRTVVDQTSDEVTKIQANLEKAGLAARLKVLCALPLPKSKSGEEGSPLAISSLRGQRADNREWSADPSRPAVICGTVDMIGSRLLFGGYAVGFKLKPLHAGFLGQDSLVVHDEAHLEPAFQKLLEAIRSEQAREPAPLGEGVRMRVMELTATSRAEGEAFVLTPDDRKNATVTQRINARKVLNLVEIDDEKRAADKITELAKRHEDAKATVVIFVRKVEDAEKVFSKLPKGRTCKLTGTLRGHERDKLVRDKLFLHFLPNPVRPEKTVYLVCTSAGEVGINISADHIVCDLSTFESMAQRLGRVNRFGTVEGCQADVVHPKSFGKEGKINELDLRRQKTLALLKKLPGNASPEDLGKLPADERVAAFSPQPDFLETSEILFDAWSFTSIRNRLPGRPPLDAYLHGIAEWEPAQTKVAWREEVEKIAGFLLDLYKPNDLLEDYPLKPHELLNDRSDRVFKHLQKLAERRPDDSIWLVDDDGTVETTSLRQLVEKGGRDRIEHRTVLLAPSTGGLNEGFLDGSAKGDSANDVSDQWFEEDGRQKRKRVWDEDDDPEGMRRIRPPIDTNPNADEEPEGDSSPGKRIWRWFELPAAAESDGSQSAKKAILWDHHTKDVVANARLIAAKSTLPEALRELLIVAAEIHDLGKKRRTWQRSIGNVRTDVWYAKSGEGMATTELSKYRHEFGSLLDAHGHPSFAALNDEAKDVVLHLVAVHHGRGRPHFDGEEAFDPSFPEAVSRDESAMVPLRFAKMQRQFGRWGLAYLESLLRAADYAASANPSLEEAGR